MKTQSIVEPLGGSSASVISALAERADSGIDVHEVRKKVVFGWNAVANRIWNVPAHGRKYRMRPERNGGGFGREASRQAMALGLDSQLQSACGNDSAGVDLLREFAESGADIGGIQVLPESTSVADVVVCGDERTVLIDEDVGGARWTPSDRDWELMSRADAVCVGGSLSDELMGSVFDIARQLKKPAFANPTRVERLDALNLDGLQIVQVSRSDFTNLGYPSDAPDAAVADALLSRGCCVAVITNSANGERAFAQGGRTVWMPAVPGVRPSFPIGAGDAAFAAHVAGFLRGLGLYDWVNVGTIAGAFFVEHGAPATWHDIARLAQKWPPERRIG
jgi:sugar/nucleoside kinase (ribokinase family)